jgi:hypothetical protein
MEGKDSKQNSKQKKEARNRRIDCSCLLIIVNILSAFNSENRNFHSLLLMKQMYT